VRIVYEKHQADCKPMPTTITNVAATNIIIALVAPIIENVPCASNVAPRSGDTRCAPRASWEAHPSVSLSDAFSNNELFSADVL
jgi:hypothetical protein